MLLSWAPNIRGNSATAKAALCHLKYSRLLHNSKTDVTRATSSRNVIAQLVFRDKVARVKRQAAQTFNSRATRFVNRALLYPLFSTTMSK